MILSIIGFVCFSNFLKIFSEYNIDNFSVSTGLKFFWLDPVDIFSKIFLKLLDKNVKYSNTDTADTLTKLKSFYKSTIESVILIAYLSRFPKK